MSLFVAEFCPAAPLRYARVDGFAYDGCAYPSCCFDPLAVFVEAVGDDGFGAVFVRGDGLGREGRGVVEFFVVGPVGTAERWSFSDKSCDVVDTVLTLLPWT